jgi:Histidine kinase-, DNA gyrase B-, and HSP90-like ATPase
MANSKAVSVQPFFGGFVLETLTIGMYGESRNAIREYVQNSFDAIQRARELGLLTRKDGKIEVTLTADGSGLSIRDNGVGISAKSAVDTLTSVGASKKDYRTNAGFRGIGRLAGIVFSDEITFTTKVRGEPEQTVVVYDGRKLREAMAPGVGGSRSAEELLTECVTATIVDSAEPNSHFFEVKLRGLVEAPPECTDFNKMKAFLCQVAPLPYSTDFPFKEKILAAAAKTQISIDDVNLWLRDGDKRPSQIFRPYAADYLIESGRVKLEDVDIFAPESAHWWAWIGKKKESGSYKDPLVRGLRVRLRNIQVDGTDIMRDVFQKHAASYTRFQDWFIGEIFADPRFLVPNARRDGFEENTAWKTMREELSGVAQTLGRQSYDVSNDAQLTVASLEKNLKDAQKKITKLRKAGFKDVDDVISLTEKITSHAKRIAIASQEADLPTIAKLQAINSELGDIKRECLSKIGADPSPPDLEQIQTAAREELIRELIGVFEQQLSTRCAGEVLGILRGYL